MGKADRKLFAAGINSQKKEVETVSTSPCTGPASGGKVVQLSNKITSMKFMQRRSLEADALAKEIGVANADLASQRGGGRRAVYVKNEQGNPLLKMCAGRRSFGGFNPAMEEYAAIQVKEYAKAVKLLGSALSKSLPEQVKNGTGTSQKHEGKDVSDKEMAKLMAGNTKRKRD